MSSVWTGKLCLDPNCHGLNWPLSWTKYSVMILFPVLGQLRGRNPFFFRCLLLFFFRVLVEKYRKKILRTSVPHVQLDYLTNSKIVTLFYSMFTDRIIVLCRDGSRGRSRCLSFNDDVDKVTKFATVAPIGIARVFLFWFGFNFRERGNHCFLDRARGRLILSSIAAIDLIG